MPEYPGVLWSGAQGPSPPLTVLGKAEDVGEGGRVLRCTLPQIERGDTGRPTVAHHFQCGGRRSGSLLGIPTGDGTGGRKDQRRRRRWGTDGCEDDPGPR